MDYTEIQKDRLEKILECYGISWSDLENLNEYQIKAIKVDYYNRYNENIGITIPGRE